MKKHRKRKKKYQMALSGTIVRKISKAEKAHIQRMEELQSYRNLGFIEGRIAEMESYRPFASIKWWIIFLLGIGWGVLISIWVIRII